MEKRKPKVLSLFSGIGGLDLGFIQAGFTPVGAYDIWEAAVSVYKKNLVSCAHVLDLSANEVTPRVSPDVVIAGSPCQGFSVIGMRRLYDPRNLLFDRAAEIAINLEPQAIVLENVPGIMSGKHRRYYDNVILKLEAKKYVVTHIELSAKEVGLPQRRNRVFIVATRLRKKLDIKSEKFYKSLGQTIAGAELEANHDPIVLDKSSRHYMIAKVIGSGQKLCDVRGGPNSVHSWNIPSVFGSTTKIQRQILHTVMRLRRQIRSRSTGDADPVLVSDILSSIGSNVAVDIDKLVDKNYLIRIENQIDLSRRFNGKFRRLDSEGISNTVDTKFGDPRYFLHPDEQRGLSIREASRIQGFPDSFRFDGTFSEQFRMIGNAVPVPMAKSVAQAVMRTITL